MLFTSCKLIVNNAPNQLIIVQRLAGSLVVKAHNWSLHGLS